MSGQRNIDTGPEIPVDQLLAGTGRGYISFQVVEFLYGR